MLILSGGEPLVRDDLPEIAVYAKGRGATVVVGTNGTTLSEPRVAMLKQAGVSGVAVSVDSLEERTHDLFRGGSHALERTKDALARLLAQNAEHHLWKGIIFTGSEVTLRADLPELARRARASGFEHPRKDEKITVDQKKESLWHILSSSCMTGSGDGCYRSVIPIHPDAFCP